MRYINKVERVNGLKLYSIANSCWLLKVNFSQCKFNDYLGLLKAVKGYSKTRWPLSGYKLGHVMRMKNDPQHTGSPATSLSTLIPLAFQSSLQLTCLSNINKTINLSNKNKQLCNTPSLIKIQS